MDKVKFIGFVIFGVTVAMLFLTILMPMFVEITGDVATEIGTSPNIDTYVGATEGIEYAPLFLYFIPAAVGIAAIVIKFKH